MMPYQSARKTTDSRRRRAAAPAARPRIARRSPRLRGVRLWLVRALALSLVPLLLAGTEVALRLTGFGYNPKVFLTGRLGGRKVDMPNPRFTWRFFPPAMARDMMGFALPDRKPAETYRILVLGESAARGDPEPTQGFSRILAVMLQAQYPTVRFEVVNTGIVAINSHVVREIARACARREPDLFIIYMGNNEVVGPYGAGTVFNPFVSSLTWIRADMFLKTFRLGQLIDRCRMAVGEKSGPSSGWRGMEMFLDRQVRADDPRMEAVYEHFRRNYLDILQYAQGAGAGVIACTVAVNLSDCAPFSSLHRPGLTAQEETEFKKLFDDGATAQADGNHDEALALYDQAARIDDSYAELRFRRAQSMSALGRDAQAQAEFRRARDLDCLRFRADARLNAIVRDLAQERRGQDFHFVDAEGILDSQSPHGSSGADFFYDHVHLNFPGSYRLAQALEQSVVACLESVLPEAADAPLPLPTQDECGRRLGYTTWMQLRVAREMLGRLGRPPFTNQSNHAQILDRATREVDRLEKAFHAEGAEATRSALEQAIAAMPGDWMLHFNNALFLEGPGQDQAAAAAQYQKTLELAPTLLVAQGNLGAVLTRLGRPREAIATLRDSLKMNPYQAHAHLSLAGAYDALGMLEPAIEHCRRAIALTDQMPAAYYRLGLMLERAGRLAEAVDQYEKALDLDPNREEISYRLGRLLLVLQRCDRGLQMLRKAAQIDGNPVIENNLAWELATCPNPADRNPDEAVRRARKACEQTGFANPAMIHTLAVAFAAAGDFAQAVTQAEKALALAQTQGDGALARQIHDHLTLFRSGRTVPSGR